MDLSPALGRAELIRVAETVAQEKGIATGEVVEALEQAIQTAAKKKYGIEHDIVAKIDRKTGEIKLFRVLNVVDEVEDYTTEIALEDALSKEPSSEIGSQIYDELPPIDLGRIAAHSAKQVIVQKVRDAERERQYEEFKDRVGEVIVGEVKRIEYGNVLVDLGRTEAILRREEIIPRELFEVKGRVRAYIAKVSKEHRGPQIFLSRAHGGFMAKLFEQEVPEIYDGIIEIKSVARDPGSRAKIAVLSKDSSIDPVGACVGMRGNRVQAVVQELMGEKVDIILWSSDPATFVVNALAPAEVSKVVLDPEANRIEVIVPDHMQHIAIGRRGQNVRLASNLTGWDIDIVSETEDSDKRNREFRDASQLFVDALNVEEVIAQLLATEGYTSVEEVALSEDLELASIQGFDEDIALALKDRAVAYLDEQVRAIEDELTTMGVQDDLRNYERLELSVILELAGKNIKSLEDFADLASDELIELLPDLGMGADEANSLIIDARVMLGWIEPEEQEVALEQEESSEEDGAISEEPEEADQPSGPTT